MNITGSVKLSTTNDNSDSLDLIIGNTNTFGPNGYQINASGSTENALFLISNLASVMVAQGTVSNPGDTSLFTNQVVGVECREIGSIEKHGRRDQRIGVLGKPLVEHQEKSDEHKATSRDHACKNLSLYWFV